MRKIVVLSFITLDGVMQAPGGTDEDTTDGFEYGGWSFPMFDESSGEMMGEQMSMPFDLLLGRKTYDIFASYWPKHEDGLAGAPFKKATKYVASNNPSLELPWKGSVLLSGDVAAKLKEIKQEDGPMLQVHGSGDLIQTLFKDDLVDELWLKIFPLTLGKGKNLWGDGVIPANFELINSKITPGGVIFANYKRKPGEIKTGTF